MSDLGIKRGRQLFRRRKWIKKRVIQAICTVAAVFLFCAGFAGCGKEISEEKVEDLEFAVIAERDAPQALQELIEKKRSAEFKLTYADGEEMYIVIGAGPQKGGGFSIAVRELYRTENAVVIRTELLGPEPGEPSGTEPSYPVVVVRTEFSEEPVVFR